MSEYKRCPHCDEQVRSSATKCKHCGSLLMEYNNTEMINNPQTWVKLALAERFELISEIGRGGMATVYRAVQKNLQREVALKVVHQNLIHDSEFLHRFHREAQLGGSLNHQNIVTVYDEGEANGCHYMSMEYLEGKDLHNLIRMRGKISPSETIYIGSAIADALNYAHKKGLIHRDIKSSNIIITNDGRPVLTDFGIAHAAAVSKLTRTGTVLGTPEYMSPEQAQGLVIDSRSDLYSLGIVLYESLTGRVPFKGDSPISTIYKIINEPTPPLRKFSAATPRWLDDVISVALEKQPEKRYSNGEQFHSALAKQKIKSGTSGPKVKIKKGKGLIDLLFNTRKVFQPAVLIIAIIIITALILFLNSINLKNDEYTDAQWNRLSDSQKNSVENYISRGDESFRRNQLISPNKNNAAEYYKAALSIHTTNAYVIDKIEKIIDQSLDEANRLLNIGKVDEASSYIKEVLKIFPQNEELKKFDTKIYLKSLEFEANYMSSTDLDRAAVLAAKILNLDSENEMALLIEKRYENLVLGRVQEDLNNSDLQTPMNELGEALRLFPSNSTLIEKYDEVSVLIARRNQEQSQQVEIPLIIGVTVEVARYTLTSRGLSLGNIVAIPSKPANRNIIIYQTPGANKMIRRGSAIDVTVGE